MVQVCLDTASKWNFLNTAVQDGWELVENLARSDSISNEEYEQSIRDAIMSDEGARAEIKILTEKFDMMLIHTKKNQEQAAPDMDIKLLLQQLVRS